MTLLCRLRSSLLSFAGPYGQWRLGCRYSSTKTSDPLRILFCGSDEFSIASLRAVHDEHLKNPNLIASIDVVHRPGKRTGRGLKIIRDVPIKTVAEKLQLPTHEIDTFTGWQPPKPQNEPINLVIAVSFGLFVPRRILGDARYGGLNVHPSMLPDLRGPAPLHHALLLRRDKIGITLQTLHPFQFDAGTILAQTPWPGLDIPGSGACTPGQLLEFVAPLGGELLVQGLRDRVFVPPLKDVSWATRLSGPGVPDLQHLHQAPKIKKEDSLIDWTKWDSNEILLRSRVLGDLWDRDTYWYCDSLSRKDPEILQKRVIFHSWKRLPDLESKVTVPLDESLLKTLGIHTFAPRWKVVLDHPQPGETSLCIVPKDREPLLVGSCTVEGNRRGTGVKELIKLLMKARLDTGSPSETA